MNKNDTFVKQLVVQSGIPRNQLASLSGLSNTYIRELENGIFTNIGREKLIALGIGLSLNLNQIDQLLNSFDRISLTTEDIPSFIAVIEKSKLTSAHIPIRDFFTMELCLIPNERIPGQHIVVSIRPTDMLKAKGNRSHTERNCVKQHPVYSDLVETIGHIRQENLKKNLANYDLDQYVCKRCLTDYLGNCQEMVERDWRIKHVENLISYLERYKRCNFYLTETCPTFIISQKIPPPSSNLPEWIMMCNLPSHQWEGLRSGQITGFITLNKGLVEAYAQEIKVLKNRVDTKLLDRSKLIAYLNDFIAKFKITD